MAPVELIAAASNWAALFNIRNVGAAIFFAVIYVLLFAYYAFFSAKRRASPHFWLVAFCIFRIISFSIRAAMASNHHGDAFKRSMADAYAIFFNLGFFALLLGAYHVLHNRYLFARENNGVNRIWNIFHRGFIVHIALFFALLFGLIGILLTYNSNRHYTAGSGLGKTSDALFTIVSLVILALAVLIIRLERGMRAAAPNAIGSGLHHGLLVLVGLLLFLRAIYFTATAHNNHLGGQQNERVWYPLAALTELLATLLLAHPGLVPVHAGTNARGEKPLMGQTAPSKTSRGGFFGRKHAATNTTGTNAV